MKVKKAISIILISGIILTLFTGCGSKKKHILKNRK